MEKDKDLYGHIKSKFPGSITNKIEKTNFLINVINCKKCIFYNAHPSYTNINT
jgi:hypothetical protein